MKFLLALTLMLTATASHATEKNKNFSQALRQDLQTTVVKDPEAYRKRPVYRGPASVTPTQADVLEDQRHQTEKWERNSVNQLGKPSW